MADGYAWQQRPLAAGIQISVATSFLGATSEAGTIGCFVRKKSHGISADDAIYMLTAAHVLKPSLKDSKLGDSIDNVVHQPVVAGWINAVGKFAPADYVWSRTLDAGLAKVDPGIGWSNYVWKIGPVAGVREPVLYELVMKCGRTTGRTYGKIDSLTYQKQADSGPIHDLLQISYCPDSQVPVSASRPKGDKLNDSDHFVSEGDSGAVIIGQDQKIVGLIHASIGGDGLACNIMKVMEELGVELAV
jgi:hypothetical protein